MTRTLPRLDAPAALQEQALIPEARQLRRRRWAIRSGIVALVCLIAGLVIVLLSTGGTRSDQTTGSIADAPPAGALTALHLAGALAAAGNGRLYVADAPTERAEPRMNANRVLVRLPDGRFRQVAANLPYISDLAVAPDGALYIADAGWVREVGRNGKIHTIAGDGHAPAYDRRTGPLPLAAGTRALVAPLGSIRSIELAGRSSPLQIAFGPGGQLYIANGDQVLRLTAGGTLDPVRGTIARTDEGPTGQLNETAKIAIAPNGTIYTSSLMQGWSIWTIGTDGIARYLTYARQSGGGTVDVQPGPHGTVYAANADSILLLNHGGPRAVFVFKHEIAREYFELTDFAVAANGVIYADELAGDGGFEAHQQLVAVTGKHITLLWQEQNRAPG